MPVSLYGEILFPKLRGSKVKLIVRLTGPTSAKNGQIWGTLEFDEV
jgi:hypothetical protein